MNALLTLGLVGGKTKNQVALVLATIVVIVALPVTAVFSLGGDVVSFLNGTPSAQSAATQGFYMGGLVPGDTYVWGNCTYWAYAMRLWDNKSISTSWGNANTWDNNAIRDGYEVDHTPTVSAIFQTDEGDAGHVAYVTAVDKVTGTWTISEMNAPHLNVVSSRTFSAQSAIYYTFIHDKKVVTP